MPIDGLSNLTSIVLVMVTQHWLLLYFPFWVYSQGQCFHWGNCRMDENWPCPVLWPLIGWAFQICWHIECSAFTTSSFRIWNISTGIPSPPLDLGSVFIPIPKKGNVKECSNYHMIALISHTSKVMLKISPSEASTVHELRTSRC